MPSFARLSQFSASGNAPSLAGDFSCLLTRNYPQNPNCPLRLLERNASGVFALTHPTAAAHLHTKEPCNTNGAIIFIVLQDVADPNLNGPHSDNLNRNRNRLRCGSARLRLRRGGGLPSRGGLRQALVARGCAAVWTISATELQRFGRKLCGWSRCARARNCISCKKQPPPCGNSAPLHKMAQTANSNPQTANRKPRIIKTANNNVDSVVHFIPSDVCGSSKGFGDNR